MRSLMLCFALSGCGNLVYPTLAELERLSPLQADPASFAVAIDLPDGFGIMPQSAKMNIGVAQQHLNLTRSEVFILRRTGQDRAVFRIADVDHFRLEAIQSLARDWEAADADATVGSLSVDLMPCRRGPGANLDETFSVAIQLAPDAPFRPLLKNAKVANIVDANDLNSLPDCPLEG